MQQLSLENYDHLSPTEAVALQKQLQQQAKLMPLQKPVTTIGGADISFNKYSDIIYAAIVVLSFPELKIIHSASVISKATFPYIPGLLAFREAPALLEVWNKLETKPDVLVLDGHGIAHPRRMGIATHFGIVAHTPTFGCGKSLLVGNYADPPNIPFATSDLVHKNEKIGAVIRTKINCKPVFISPGNLITMDECISIISQCITRYRIPEPTRQAHLLVNEIRVSDKQDKHTS